MSGYRCEERHAVDPLPGEEWRPIAGYEGRYAVSNLGRIRSFARPSFGRLLRAATKDNGYQYVSLVSDGRRNHHVHRLVADAFCERLPGEDVVRHRNDVKADNRAANLQWGTQQDNVNDCIERGRHWWRDKTHCVNGHEFTPENTYSRRDRPRARVCRECALEIGRRIYHRKKAQREAAA